jgi:alpha-amylase
MINFDYQEQAAKASCLANMDLTWQQMAENCRL